MLQTTHTNTLADTHTSLKSHVQVVTCVANIKRLHYYFILNPHWPIYRPLQILVNKVLYLSKCLSYGYAINAIILVM